MARIKRRQRRGPTGKAPKKHGRNKALKPNFTAGKPAKTDKTPVEEAKTRTPTAKLVGILRQTPTGGEVEVLTGEPRVTLKISPSGLNGAPFGMMVVCKPDAPLDLNNPHGVVEEVLGPPDRPDVALEGIFCAHDMAVAFPEEVEAEAEAYGNDLAESVVEEEIRNGRKDLRGLLTLTIDGEDAKDLDDAISLEPLGNGGVRLYVHIADVSHYVKEGSALDEEAVKRGTSVYPVDRVIPMLPTRLSNGICSLNPHKPRLTLTARMDYDAAGRRVDGDVFESVICSDLRGDYTHVYSSLNEGKPAEGYEKVWPMLQQMYTLSKKLESAKKERGCFGFDFPETKVELDADGKPTDIHPYVTNFANDLIENFMVEANRYIAERFYNLAAPFLYRVHEYPDPLKIQNLLSLCRYYGLKPPKTAGANPKELAKLLLDIQAHPEGQGLAQLLLRSLAKARYTDECLGHYGLALKFYCHFTSPIRRYPDLFIHRVIKGYLHGRPRTTVWRGQAGWLGDHCSACERESVVVERETKQLKIAEYMSERLGEVFEGQISGFSSAGFFVQLKSTAEGLVPWRSLPEYYAYDEWSMTAKAEHSHRVLRLGMELRVRVAAVNMEKRQVDFEWVTDKA